MSHEFYLEVDGRRRVPGLYSDDAGLHLGRGTEVVLANVHQMINPAEKCFILSHTCFLYYPRSWNRDSPGQQLCVDWQPAVQLVSRLGHEAKCKLSLEHKHCAPAKITTIKEKMLRQTSIQRLTWKMVYAGGAWIRVAMRSGKGHWPRTRQRREDRSWSRRPSWCEAWARILEGHDKNWIAPASHFFLPRQDLS